MAFDITTAANELLSLSGKALWVTLLLFCLHHLWTTYNNSQRTGRTPPATPLKPTPTYKTPRKRPAGMSGAGLTPGKWP